METEIKNQKSEVNTFSRMVIPTDQEFYELPTTLKKIGLELNFPNTPVVRIRTLTNQELKDKIINSTFEKNEREHLSWLCQTYPNNPFIHFTHFGMDRVLSKDEITHLQNITDIKECKHTLMYDSIINQSYEEFEQHYEETKKQFPDKKILAMLDPAELDTDNLSRKAIFIKKVGECAVVFRDCVNYIDGWRTISAILGDNTRVFVLGIYPRNREGVSNLLAPFFFGKNIIVSHGRKIGGGGGGDGDVTYLNDQWVYETNKELDKKMIKSKRWANSVLYSIVKARELCNTLGDKNLSDLTQIEGVRYFADKFGFLNVRRTH